MSIKGCLDTARRAGEIEPEEHEAMLKLYDSLVKHYGDANIAKAEMVERLMRQAEQKKRQKLLADEARAKVENVLLSFRDARGQPDPAKAMVFLLEHNGQAPMPEGMSSVHGRARAILSLAAGKMEGLLHEFRRTAVTGATRNIVRLKNVVREAFGESTGDNPAAGFAKAWVETAELLRQRFNAAGGAIGKLEKWGMPQVHDRRALLNAGKDTWIAYIERRIDLEKMRHPLTGKAMTPGDLRESLDWIWRNITSDGWLEREATSRPGGLGAISNRRTDSRFLVFKDADSWLEYQAEFGGGSDPFAAMMHHIKAMAEDIAALEILGPNPRATLTYMQNFVERQAALKAARQPAIFPEKTEFLGASFEVGGSWLSTKNPEDYARAAIRLSDNMWDMYRHNMGGAVNQRVADIFDTVRNLNVASKLGAASISALTDIGYQQVARKFSALPFLNVYTDYLKGFTRGSKRDAARAAVVFESGIAILHDQARWTGAMHGPAWTRYLADRTIAWSGLQAWTESGKMMFAKTIMAQLASDADKPFANLPKPMQRAFRRYGITPSDWDAMRLGDEGLPLDVDLLEPGEIYARMQARGRETERLSERYLEMMLQESEYAVPTGTLQAQAKSYGGLQRGVLRDELYRSMGQFKMFGISVALLQAQRIAAEMVTNGLWRGSGYAAALLITTTLYGALALQLKDIAKGKDPRPMIGDKGAAFWGGALLQGGGMGIYGDFLASESNRFGGGFARTLAGPTADVAGSTLNLTAGNAMRFMKGDKMAGGGRDLVRFLGSNTPGGSLWYLRLAYERMVIDQLQKMVDPEAYSAFRRRVSKQRKDYHSDYFWAPGQRRPLRGPKFKAAVGR